MVQRRPGQEASDNARIWRLYQGRMNEMDEDTVSAWNDLINFPLIFVRRRLAICILTE